MKINFKLFLFLLASISVFSQTETTSSSFTLKQAIEQAQKNNYSVVNANRDLEIAKQKKWETTTMGLPQLNGSVNYQNTFEFQKQGAAGNAFNPMADPNDITLLAFGTKHTAIGNLTLSQLIFDGSYLVGLQSAKTYLKISENAQVKTNQEIKEIVINSYGNVLLADESILIINKNKVVLEKILSDTKEIYKNGLIEEENIEQLQITLNSVNNALENVTKQRVIALNMVKLLLGINLDDPILLSDNLKTLTQENIDLQVLASEFNVNNNIDYQIGKNVEESKRLIVKLEKSKALPSLGAQLNFGYNAFSNEFTFFNADQKWSNYSNLGVGLTVPIFSSGARSSRVQQAKIDLEKSRTQLTETEQKLKLQHQKAKSDYEYSINQYNNAQANLKLAERIENKQQVKFKEGLSSSFDFAEAQKQLYTAQQEVLQAMLEIVNKKATLEKLLN
ncbi:TolC family protein [Flavobacterium terrigena]|uniref:Outer membrane protein TolC n=1 Tax=Flavobacterium terrigena TaxID=402734 RepID=A0A1H6Y9Q1_9FLAO|nr:TolC family protein [Flavobacterium terrigena]SEJ37216.1 Outer membrane protein TolC [Flavobacterium terrigena]